MSALLGVAAGKALPEVKSRCGAPQPGLDARSDRRPRRCHRLGPARHPQHSRHDRPRRARRRLLARGLRGARRGPYPGRRLRHRGHARPGPPGPPDRPAERIALGDEHSRRQVPKAARWSTPTWAASSRSRSNIGLMPGPGTRAPPRRHARRALRDPRPHRRGRARRSAARGRCGARDDATDTPRRRRRDVTHRRPAHHGRVRRGLRRPQPDPHLRRRRPARRPRQPDRARHVALGRRPARGGRGGSRELRPRRVAHRMDRPVPRHGAPRREIDVRVDRIAVDAGAEIVEVACRVDGDLVMVATGRTAAPKTVVRLPRPGHPAPGHGPRRPHPLQGRPRGLGPRRRAHPRGARLLDPRGRARQPDRTSRPAVSSTGTPTACCS